VKGRKKFRHHDSVSFGEKNTERAASLAVGLDMMDCHAGSDDICSFVIFAAFAAATSIESPCFKKSLVCCSASERTCSLCAFRYVPEPR